MTAEFGASNQTAFELRGSGNVVRDNIAFDAAGVIQPGTPLVDGGGNRVADPKLDAHDVATAAGLAGYGTDVGTRFTVR